MALEIENQVAQASASNQKSAFANWFKKIGVKKVSAKDRVFFFQQIQLLLETGTPLHSGLQTLRSQTGMPAMTQLIDDLATSIDEGKSFSYALAQHPDVFSATHVNLIAASEEGGFMHEVLQQLLEMEEKREQLRSTLLSAISYPAFLMAFSFAVVVFVLVVVFPKFADLFAKIHDQLPVTTKALMWTSNFLIEYWIALLVAFVLSLVALARWMSSGSGGKVIDRFKLKAPLLKNIFAQVYLVQSMRVMGLALANGVNIVDAVASCKESIQNKHYQDFLSNVIIKIQEGSGISSGFAKVDFIPPIVQQMIRTGEETGNLPRVMSRVADHYEQELLKHLKGLTKLAEPVMLLVMGGIVGVIVSSLILPIFSLSRAVQ